MPHARFQLTEADVVAAARADWWRATVIDPMESRPGAVLAVVAAFPATTWLLHQLFHHHDQLQDALADYVLAPLFCLFIILLLSWKERKRVVLRRFRDDPARSMPHDIAWDEEGLEAGSQGSQRVAWERFARWAEGHGVMLLYRDNVDYLVAPARVFGPGDCFMMRACLERAGVPERSRGWWRGST